MKYTIYKFNFYSTEGTILLNEPIWWRNYDKFYFNYPDMPIESYLSTKFGNHWEILKNSRNENAKYETITKDSLDEIDIYFDNIKNIPKYIKIVFELETGAKSESVYYYPKNPPSIYNTVTSVSSTVRFVMDKWASFGYEFHNTLKTNNPKTFFVRKHHPRVNVSGSNVSLNYLEMPWLCFNNDSTTNDLIVRTKKNIKHHQLFNMINKPFTNIEFNYNQMGALEWRLTGGTYTSDMRCTKVVDSNTGTAEATSYVTQTIDDRHFCHGTALMGADAPYYEYIVTKTNGFNHGNGDITILDSFMLWPIINSKLGPIVNSDWGSLNKPDVLSLQLPTIFKSENIIGRFTSPLSPCTIAALYSDRDSTTGLTSLYAGATKLGQPYNWGCILVNGNPQALNINYSSKVLFTEALDSLLANFKTVHDYRKINGNNPHLFAPQNWQLVYAPTTNDKAILTADYMSLTNTAPQKVLYELFIFSDWYSRFNLEKSDRNSRKMLSQSGNEMLVSESKQAPIQCSAWANSYSNLQSLDMGRNAQIGNLIASLSTGMLGIGLSASKLNPQSMLSTAAGGFSGFAKDWLISQSEYNLQKKQYMQQANSYNAPANMSGLTTANWSDLELNFYTMSLNDVEQDIINMDDNMYGYYVKQWMNYANYDTCWHGNYLLCDISKNYSTLFSILKKQATSGTYSLFKISDKYINEFLNMLNNGITLFANGNYVDLANDLQNWEKIFPQPTI